MLHRDKAAIILALFLPMDQKLFSALYVDRPLNPPGGRNIAKYSLQKA